MSPPPTAVSTAISAQMLALTPPPYMASALPLALSLPATAAQAAPMQPFAETQGRSPGRVVTSVKQLLQAASARSPITVASLPLGSHAASQMQVAVASGMLQPMPLPSCAALPCQQPSHSGPVFALAAAGGHQARQRMLQRSQHAKHSRKPMPSSRKRSPSPSAFVSHGRKGGVPKRAAIE